MKRFSRAEAAPSGDAARVGEELRDARESSGLSIEDMSAALRIRRVYLIALEEGRMRDLPSPAYAWGFVRNYSNALGLDADEMVRRFRESAGQTAQKRQDLIFPEPVTERGVPAGIIVVLGAVLAVAAYVGWYNWTGSPNRTVDAIPAVPPRLERAAREGTAPEPVSPPPLAVPGLSGGGSALPGSNVTLPTPVPVVVPPPPPPPAPPPSPTDVSRITVRFKADSWMQLRAPGQTPVVQRIFRAGESFTAPNQPGLVLSLALANAAELLIDGQVQANALPTTPIRRDVQLDPLLARFVQAQNAARQGASTPQGTAPRPAGAAAPAPGPAPASPGASPGAAPVAAPGAPNPATRPAQPAPAAANPPAVNR